MQSGSNCAGLPGVADIAVDSRGSLLPKSDKPDALQYTNQTNGK